MARTAHLLLLTLCLLSFAPLEAVTIPPGGRFPAGFWDDILSGRDSLRYGDPGWVKRMKARRETRKQIAAGQATLAALDQAQFTLPVLLGRFSGASTTFEADDFNQILFGENPTGSLTDYYNEISLWQFDLSGDVYGWFTLPNPKSFYKEADNSSSFPNNRDGFVYDAVAAADPEVDFSLYDNNGPDGEPNSGDDDGYVDGVYVIFPGLGADQTNYGDPDNLWPASSRLGRNEYTTNDISINGDFIKVNTWAIAPELYARTKETTEIHPIGVFAHEFGHILGMPDLYDRTDEAEGPDFNDSEGLGNWCLMAGGSWGGDGDHPEAPSHMSVWCKYLLGWLSPMTVEQAGEYQIDNIESNNQTYKLWQDGFRLNSYFLIENRQKAGFDRFLEGNGLLIYHVDESRWWGEASFSNGVNNDDEANKLVDLEEADGWDDLDKNENRGDDGDPWPGSTGNRSFNSTSIPSSLDYSGNPTGVAIENISNSGLGMSAFFQPATPIGYSISYDEQGIYYWRIGFDEPTDYWSGVLFTTGDGGNLEALDIGFPDNDISYTIEIYSSLNNNFGSYMPSGLLTKFSSYAYNSGWETVFLPEAIKLNQGQDFFVSLGIYNSDLVVSYDRLGERSGRSYTSDDGINFANWINTSEAGGDINIRARVRTFDPNAAPIPAISIDSMSFGGVSPGRSSQKSFQLYNLGDAALSATLTVSGDAAFAVSPAGAGVAPGDSQAVTVTFSPLLDGDYAGSVTITGGESPLTVSLSGSGRVMAVFAGSIGDETFSDSDGGYELWVKLNDVLVNPEVWIVFSLDGGETFDEYSMCLFDGEKWAGVIPAQPLGTVIPFYFEAIDEGGEIVTLPDAAPDESWTLTIAEDKPGDLDGNWDVNIFDLLDLLKGLGKPDDTGLRDIDGNGRVDIFDLLDLLKLMARD